MFELCVRAKLLQCGWLCNLMDCRPPGSSVPRILQARILEWVAMPSSKRSSPPRDWSHTSYVSCIAGGFFTKASLVAQTVKRLPAMRETRVRFLGREDPLEKEMVTHSSILAWRIPWMETPRRLQSTGSQRVRYDWMTSPSPLPSPSPGLSRWY